VTAPKPKTVSDLRALLDAQKAKIAAKQLPPHDPNAPPSPPSSTAPASAPSKLPKGFTDGLMGAAIGHAADSILPDKSKGMGMGSLLLGGLAKMLAASLKGTDDKTAETLNAMGTGALMAGAAKAATNFKPESHPLVEEAQKAVAEMEKSGMLIDQPCKLDENPGCRCTCGACGQGLHLACNFQCEDARRKGEAFVEPLVEEARKAVAEMEPKEPR
jgi:hypothetical protein